MEKNFKPLLYLYKGKIVILTILIVGLLFGFLYSYRNYQGKNYFELTFSYVDNKSLADENDFYDKDKIKKVQNLEYSYFTQSKITTYKNIDVDNSNMKVKNENGLYSIKVYKNAITSNNVTKTAVKGFLQHLAIFVLSDSYWENDEVKTGVNSKGNEYEYHTICYDVFNYDSAKIIEINDEKAKKLIPILSIVGACVGLVCGISVVMILGYKNPHLLEDNINYDNDKLFKTPFKKAYWKKASKTLKIVKNLVMISILLSMVMVAKLITLPSGFGNLGLNFSYLFLSIGSMLFGPFAALLTGFLSDTIGFIIKPDGVFFPGYTLSAMLACFTYAIFFYKTKITFTKCLLARVIVNFIINALLGSIWYGIYASLSFKATFDYMLLTSLPKNTAYLLPQSIVLFIVLKAVAPICHKAGYLDEENVSAIKLF